MRKGFFFTILLINTIIFSATFFNSVISAQWVKIPQITLSHVFAAGFDGSDIYAGGDSLVFISTDSGVNWRSSALLKDRSASSNCFIKIGGAVFAGTYGQGVFRSTDNGISWVEYNEGLSDWGKYVISFIVSGDTVFIGTDGGGVYFSNYKSLSPWQEFNTGLPSLYGWTLSSLCLSGKNLIASSGASGYYYIRPLNAPEWTEKTVHPVKTPNVYALANIGDVVFAGTTKGIYRSKDYGLSWDSVGIKAMPIYVTHLAADKNRIFAGYSRGADYFLWYSEDLGDSWKVQDHQFAGLYNFYIYNNRIWAATDSGLMYFKLTPSPVEKDQSRFSFSLEQNYPNPFNPTTVITFSLKEDGFIKLSVYDILGREAKAILNEYRTKGTHKINFNSAGLARGVYFYRLTSGNNSYTRKLTIL